MDGPGPLACQELLASVGNGVSVRVERRVDVDVWGDVDAWGDAEALSGVCMWATTMSIMSSARVLHRWE